LGHRIGVIGGSGLYNMEGLTNLVEEFVDTPFGKPSDALIHGVLDGVEMVFLPRHGRGHRLNPSEVPYRANIFALKQAGVDWIISVSAVGSLREEIVPGHVVVVDQFIDRTKNRAATFFEKGIVAHVSFGDPVCSALRQYLVEAADETGATHHDGGTYVCMEGPVFSTRAESELYRSWGASVIGMTNLPEAKLAREAEISYATLAMATDYDCWHMGHDEVSVEAVLAVVKQNVEMAQKIIRTAVGKIASHEGPAPMSSALDNAIMTQPDLIPEQILKDLSPIVGKYF
jgi:5'-methylthioadenosine phosphorylase